jgi:hypothetical protein
VASSQFNLHEPIFVLTGTTSSTVGASTSISLPSNVSQDNCVVLGIQYKNPADAVWRTMGAVGADQPCVITVTIGPASLIIIPRAPVAVNCPFKVTLYRYA